MTLGATLVASFLVTLARPATWVLALFAFLVRGGLLLLVAPIVVLPTAVGLANVLAPFLTRAWLDGPTGEVILAIAAAAAVVVGVLGLGGLLAGLAEAEMIRIVAADDETGVPMPSPHGRPVRGQWSLAGRILAVRLVALAPLAVALAVGTVRIVEVTYRELTVPSSGGGPLVVRVIVAAPEAVAAVVVAWAVGEMVGALAARRVAMAGDGVWRAVAGAIGQLLRRPARTLVLFAVPLGALLVVLVPTVLATVTAKGAVQASLAASAGAGPALLAIVTFVVLWVAGLVLVGMVGAWRAAAWTVNEAGTFGVVATRRPGDWSEGRASGTLSDPRPGGVDPDPR